MKLVDDWKDFWKWHSTQILAILAAMPVVWAQLPPDLKAAIPDEYLPYIASLVALSGILARVKKQ